MMASKKGVTTMSEVKYLMITRGEARRRVGLLLRKLREERGITPGMAAEMVEDESGRPYSGIITPGFMKDIEAGDGYLELWELVKILHVYGQVSPETFGRFLECLTWPVEETGRRVR